MGSSQGRFYSDPPTSLTLVKPAIRFRFGVTHLVLSPVPSGPPMHSIVAHVLRSRTCPIPFACH